MYPSNWQPGEIQGSFGPIYNPRPRMVIIGVDDVKSNSTLENILRDDFSSIRSDSDLKYIIMSEPNKTKLKDGSDAYQYQYDYYSSATSSLPKREFDLVTVKDGLVYHFSYGALTEEFNRYLPIVKTMIETFQPLGYTFD
jgi:hypothetical protein